MRAINARPKQASEQLDAFRDLLEVRLRRHRGTYRLDLRCRQLRWVGGNYLQVRNPRDPEWPARGRATDDEGVAKQWVREKYASYLLKKQRVPYSPSDRPLTVREAAQEYVESLQAGDLDSMETRSRRPRINLVKRHIIEPIGDELLVNLTTARVRSFLATLTKLDAETGERTTTRLSVGTLRNVVNALSAIWERSFEDVPPPFRNVRKMLKEDTAARRQRIRRREDLDSLRKQGKSFKLEHVQQLLVAAVFYDQECLRRPNLRRTYIENTAFSMALGFTAGLRVSETVMFCWEDFDWSNGVLHVRGTKSDAAMRTVPLQRSLKPWFDQHWDNECRRLGRNPFLKERVFHSSAKRWDAATVLNNLSKKWRRVAAIAALKVGGKNTHAARSTYATLMQQSGKVPLEWLRFYLGHNNPFGDQTTGYVDVDPRTFDSSHADILQILDPRVIQEQLDQAGQVNGFRPRWVEKGGERSVKSEQRGDTR